MAYAIGRFLQACGLILAPMAIFFYEHHASASRAFGLGTMEWMILLSAVLVFLIGRFIERL